MPKGWKKVKLGDLVLTIKGGGTPSKKVPEYWNGDIPWASVKDMKEDSVYLSKTTDYITEVGLNKSSSNLIPSGTVTGIN
jgi:restriction endonuclease S subunit